MFFCNISFLCCQALHTANFEPYKFIYQSISLLSLLKRKRRKGEKRK